MNEKEAIREIIKERRMTQADLANAVGASQQSIAGYLNRGDNGMRIDILLKLCKAMNCEIVIRDKVIKGNEWVIG